jgi:HD-like signal output (HDOD) protein
MRLVDPRLYIELAGSGKLPTPQRLALAIRRLLQNDNYKIDHLVKLVQSDPALVGELLKFSNAAAYGNSRPIVSIPKAVVTLGTRRVGLLVIALSVLHSNRRGYCPEFNYERYWSRSLLTALAAQALSPYAKINDEDNFTAGLLCMVGELALASIFPSRYGEMIAIPEQRIQKRLELEREAFNTDHRELTATMLINWGLPEVLVTAIYHCESPDESEFIEGSRIHGLSLSLQIAFELADICIPKEVYPRTTLPTLLAHANRLGINFENFYLIADSIITNWLEWGELLGIQTREIPSFANLLASSKSRN